MNLENFIREFGEIAKSGEAGRIIEKGAAPVAELSANDDFVDECLARILIDGDFMSMQKESVWPNEVTVYRHPERTFSILMYIWETGMADIVHDHNSWGIVCVARGQLEETKYRRLDDGSRPYYAELETLASKRMNPRGITSVLPFNEGIHEMKNVDNGPTITFNVYGIPAKRGHILFFDPQRRSYKEAYPPRTLTKVLAARALAARPEKAQEVLGKASGMKHPQAVLDEVHRGLSLLKCTSGR